MTSMTFTKFNALVTALSPISHIGETGGIDQYPPSRQYGRWG
jgi:hypothetical protein